MGLLSSIGGALLGPVGVGLGTVAAGLIGARGARDAASEVRQGADAATAESARQFDIARGILQPAIDARDTALGNLSRLLDEGGPEALAALRETPGYQFIVDEAERALDARRNATGTSIGGGTLAELQRLRMGAADQTFNSTVAREMARAGLGTAGANQTANAAIQTGAITGSALQNAGNATASGIVGRTNSIGNALNNLSFLAGVYGPGQGAASVLPPAPQFDPLVNNYLSGVNTGGFVGPPGP